MNEPASPSSFEQRVRPLLRRSAGYARAIVQDRDDADDAVQDALLKAHRSFDRFDPARPFEGWWFAILRSCCLDLLRTRASRAREQPLVDSDPPAPTPAPAAPDAPDWTRLRRALHRLSSDHRAILELRYFGDCSYRAIADALAIPMGTVMSRLHAARAALARVYGNCEEESS